MAILLFRQSLGSKGGRGFSGTGRVEIERSFALSLFFYHGEGTSTTEVYRALPPGWWVAAIFVAPAMQLHSVLRKLGFHRFALLKNRFAIPLWAMLP